jgi:hypothetical protein
MFLEDSMIYEIGNVSVMFLGINAPKNEYDTDMITVDFRSIRINIFFSSLIYIMRKYEARSVKTSIGTMRRFRWSILEVELYRF